MSRYQIEHPNLLIHVGYDQPLQTYFASVEDLNIEDEESSLLLWVGTSYQEIKSLDQLKEQIKDYAALPSPIASQLEFDSHCYVEPTPLQKSTRHLFDDVDPQ